ncbi:MAG: tetratricopeptide repeat protein, partial [Gemmatimonadetes bacterium]|nr:tetratricopeptide repeat protein [Gemmatimonadota bacterium]
SSEVLEDVDTRAAFHRMLGNVLLHRGKLDDAESQFQMLEGLGTSHERGDWVARGLEYRGRIEWYRGRLDGARSLFEEGLTRVGSDESATAADLHNDLGIVFYTRGDAERAFEEHAQALKLRERLGDRLALAKSLSNFGNLLATFRDDLEAAQEHYQRALELAREAGDRQQMSLVLNNLGYMAMERGEWEAAIESFGRVGRLQEEMGWFFLTLLTLQNQVQCEISLGRIGDALAHLRTCQERGDAILEPINRVNTRFNRFDACLRALLDDEAEQAKEDARRLVAQLGVPEQQEEILLREGRWLVARGKWDEAVRAFALAKEAARKLNHRPVELLAEAHRCRAAARTGDDTGGECPSELRGRLPLQALLRYLFADAEAERGPTLHTATALREAGELANRIGEICLARAAFEREAHVWHVLAKADEEQHALRRALLALNALEAQLPERARPSFLVHPRNQPLLSRRSELLEQI